MTDFDQYELRRQKFNAMLDAGRENTQEFRDNWAEMERIKNRNGGLPPKEKCFLHPDRDAGGSLNIPCAPGGKIWICSDCVSDPDVLRKTFEAYFKKNEKTVRAFKLPRNPDN